MARSQHKTVLIGFDDQVLTYGIHLFVPAAICNEGDCHGYRRDSESCRACRGQIMEHHLLAAPGVRHLLGRGGLEVAVVEVVGPEGGLVSSHPWS